MDRAYTPEGLLVPRTEPNAMLSDPAAAAARAVEMVTEGEITAVDGSRIPIKAEAILVHCDTAGAVEIARDTRRRSRQRASSWRRCADRAGLGRDYGADHASLR